MTDTVKERDEKVKGLAVAAAVLLFLAGAFYIYSAASTLSFIEEVSGYIGFRQIYIRNAVFGFAFSASYITIGVLALIPGKKKAAAIIALCPVLLQLLVLIINLGNIAAYSESISGLTLNILGSLLSFSITILPPLFLGLYFLNVFKRPKTIFFIFPGAIGLSIILNIVNIFSYSEPSIRINLFVSGFLPAIVILTGYMLLFLSYAYPKMRKAPFMPADGAWNQNPPQCYAPQNHNAALNEDNAALLRELYDLKVAGIITEAEFEEKKRLVSGRNYR